MSSEEIREYPDQSAGNLFQRFKYYLNPFDNRYEDLKKGNLYLNLSRDLMAGLIVAMVAIPLAMGFAMASGLRPEQGIVGGAVAGLLGALFGGSKYQVYGPTAAFIPIIGSIMAAHGYPMLVLASILAGIILMLLGLARFGRFVAMVPHSIVVGFTMGIAVIIAFSQSAEVFGFKFSLGYDFFEKIITVINNLGLINQYAFAIAIGTFLITKILLKVSPFIPAPLVTLALGTLIASTVWADKGLILIKDKFGRIPTDFLVFSTPAMPTWEAAFLIDLLYFAIAIVFVAAIESLLCSRMADRLAGNKGTPYNPNKELWGQGIVNIVVPLLNGFPHTGALARTATNIKLGAISPLAGIFKFIFKLLLAAYMASYLELVPMACIGGILLFVASGMVKKQEVEEVMGMSNIHKVLMAFTAILVVLEDFLTGVLAALVIYGIIAFFFKSLVETKTESKKESELANVK